MPRGIPNTKKRGPGRPKSKQTAIAEVELPKKKRGRPKKGEVSGGNGSPEKKTRKKRHAALSDVGTHKLRKDQLLKYRTLESEVQTAQLQVQVCKMVLQNIIRETPPVSKAMASVEAAKRVLTTRHAEYIQYMKTLSESVGLDLAHCSIDENSGLVREIPQGNPDREN